MTAEVRHLDGGPLMGRKLGEGLSDVLAHTQFNHFVFDRRRDRLHCGVAILPYTA
ncbi:MAG: hypothetical protein WD156_10835 [Acidimicrobiia bacterium]